MAKPKRPLRVGHSPVARAVARERLRKTLVTRQIQLHLLEPGEECRALLTDLNWVMAVTYTGYGLMGRAQECPDIAEGLQSLISIAKQRQYHWQPNHLRRIALALEQAIALEPAIPMDILGQAIEHCTAAYKRNEFTAP